MHETLLKLDQLSLSYGSKRVLDGIDIQVGKAEIVGLLGPNGSGKSSAIAAMLGLCNADCQQFQWKNRVIRLGDPHFRQQIGVLLQAGSIDPKLSAVQNLRLSAKLYGVPKKLATQRIEEWLAFSSLSEQKDQQIKTFSGGMKRKVEFGRALLHQPELLILDEPTTGFDELAYQQSWSYLVQEKERRELSILLTTHRPEEAERCDRILLLDQGKIIAQGSPAKLKGALKGDVIQLECKAPSEVALEIQQKLNLKALVLADRVQITHAEGHKLIPRLIENLDEGKVLSVSMHRPTLADVFIQYTGRSFNGQHAS
ncbi:MAG: ABC transporter ATP-binding protein [Myxococcales bacterium]|nr:MAG: ABC transporter ATP-binding protein [Myxococcales bacterium]